MEFFKNLFRGKYTVYAAIAAAGLLLVAAGGAFRSAKKPQSSFDEKEYVSVLESRVCAMVSSIKGAGDCRVMINISSTTESVYVKESKSSASSDGDASKSESENSVLTMTDRDGNQYAVVRKQIMPHISGVSVVCDGGGDPTVRAQIIDAVCTVLDVGANKVCVIAKAK